MEEKYMDNEQSLICDLMFSILTVALAEFHPALPEPVGQRRNMEWLPQLLSREDALELRRTARIKSNSYRTAD